MKRRSATTRAQRVALTLFSRETTLVEKPGIIHPCVIRKSPSPPHMFPSSSDADSVPGDSTERHGGPLDALMRMKILAEPWTYSYSQTSHRYQRWSTSVFGRLHNTDPVSQAIR